MSQRGGLLPPEGQHEARPDHHHHSIHRAHPVIQAVLGQLEGKHKHTQHGGEDQPPSVEGHVGEVEGYVLAEVLGDAV
jgi:hypothetical protein